MEPQRSRIVNAILRKKNKARGITLSDFRLHKNYSNQNSSSSVQFSSVSKLCPTLCDHMNARSPCPSPTLGVYSNPCPSSRWCHPAISSSVSLLLLPPIPPSIKVFSNESTLLMRWPKYWSFSFIISSSNEHPGLISFRMDWLDLLAVKGLLRVFSNTTVQKHQFFGAQLSLRSKSHIHTWPLEKL